MDKKQIRQQMKTQRAKLSRETVLAYSNAIWEQIYPMDVFKSATTLLLYSSFGNEVNTVPLAHKALALGKRVAYPVTNMDAMTMTFHSVKDLSELLPVTSGSFKLHEPKANSKTIITPDATTLMIVPGLAFDQDFYRTGYGGGFYDKYLASYPELATLGVCYGFQLVERLARDSYDRPVAGLVTVGLDGAIN